MENTMERKTQFWETTFNIDFTPVELVTLPAGHECEVEITPFLRKVYGEKAIGGIQCGDVIRVESTGATTITESPLSQFNLRVTRGVHVLSKNDVSTDTVKFKLRLA